MITVPKLFSAFDESTAKLSIEGTYLGDVRVAVSVEACSSVASASGSGIGSSSGRRPDLRSVQPLLVAPLLRRLQPHHPMEPQPLANNIKPDHLTLATAGGQLARGAIALILRTTIAPDTAPVYR
jgi:hypothetical protein